LRLLNNNHSSVLLKKSKNNPYGRCHQDHSLSLFSIRCTIRNTLCYDLYEYIDIVNCHIVILYQICIKNNIKVECIEKYVNNRQYYLNLVIKEYSVDRYEAKKLFIILLYGGSFKKWCVDNKTSNNKCLNKTN